MPSPGLRPEDLRVGVWGREEALFYLIDQESVYRMISYGYIVFAARFHPRSARARRARVDWTPYSCSSAFTPRVSGCSSFQWLVASP